MKNRNVELINIARIDLLKGKTNVDLEELAKILLDNYDNKFDQDIGFYYEDSVCPPNKYVDAIVERLKRIFMQRLMKRLNLQHFGDIFTKKI